MRRTADGLVPVLLVLAVGFLVILGAGAFKQPGYRGSDDADAGPPRAEVTATATPSPTATAKPKPTATPKPKHKKKKTARRHHKTVAPAATAAPVRTAAPVVTAAPVRTAAPVYTAAPVQTAAPKPVVTAAPPRPQSTSPGTTTIDDSG